MSLEPGFCTPLDKIMLVCSDAMGTPKNFTAFLTPPVNIEYDDKNYANLLKLAFQENFDNSDLLLLIKMEVTIPMGTTDLKHSVKNYVGCVGRVFGEDSMVYAN